MWLSRSIRSAERRRPAGGRLPLAAVVLLLAPGLWAQAGASPPEPPSTEGVPFNFFINKRPAGLLFVRPEGARILVERDSLLKALGDRLSPEARARVQSLQPVFPPEELAADGFSYEFDENLLEARLKLDPRQLAPELLRLQTGLEFMDARDERPAMVSGFVNGRLKTDAWYKGNSAGGGAWSLPLQLGLEPTLNVAGWAAETGIQVERNQDMGAELEYARLVRDSDDGLWRFNLGSLLLPVTGYQSYMRLAGIGMSFDPARTAVARGRKSPLGDIYLERPAKVEVFLNDRLIKSMRADAGRLRLLDVPFTTGINALRVDVTEEGGLPVTRSISAPYDARMLDPLEHSFHASLGVPQWQAGQPIASGYYLFGFLPDLTVGTNAQAGLERQIGGIESVWATPAGNFKTDLGLSTRAGAAFDFGGRLSYRLALPGRRDAPGLGLAVEYAGGDFLGPAALQASNDYSWRFTAGYGQGLPGGVGLNLSAGYRVGRGAAADTANGSLTLFRPLGGGLTFNLNLTVDAPIGQLPVVRAVFTFISNPPAGPHLVSVSNSVTGDGASVDYQYRPDKPGQPEFSAGADGLPVNPRAPMSGRFGARYENALVELSLGNGSWSYPGESIEFMNRVTLQAASAVAFADGEWAVTRPITDAFALIKPSPELAGYRLEANPGKEGLSTSAEGGRPGVLPRLVSYAPVPLEIEVPEAPPGLELADFRRLLHPTYRSGILVEVQAVRSLYGEGRLNFIDGKPAALEAGEITGLDRPGSAPVEFFTDENGRFQVHGLEPGRYSLRLYVHEMARTEFELDSGAAVPVELGTLSVPVLRKEK